MVELGQVHGSGRDPYLHPNPPVGRPLSRETNQQRKAEASPDFRRVVLSVRGHSEVEISCSR